MESPVKESIYRLQVLYRNIPTFLNLVFKTQEQAQYFLDFDNNNLPNPKPNRPNRPPRFAVCETEALVLGDTCWIASKNNKLKELTFVSEELFKSFEDFVKEASPEMISLIRFNSFESF
jgi:hypothetical protein